MIRYWYHNGNGVLKYGKKLPLRFIGFADIEIKY